MPDGIVVDIPPGAYPVRVTVADVSDAQDGSHFGEAYLSLVIGEGVTTSHAPIIPTGRDAPGQDAFYGVAVDAGSVAFVDETFARTLMPTSDVYDEVFDTGRPDSWFAQMDASAPLPAGYANIRLPLATNDENIVISHSGWGDGFYPVIGSRDSQGNLIAVHIDLHVVGDFRVPGVTA